MFSPDTESIAVDRLARLSRVAAPTLTPTTVFQAVQDALSGGETPTRRTLAEDFDVSPSSFPLRRILCELADQGRIGAVSDEVGADEPILLPAKTTKRKKAA